jgi:dienelactone hydrolase
VNPSIKPLRAAAITALVVLSSALPAALPSIAHAALPDPLVRGPFAVTTLSVTPPTNTGVAVGQPGGPVGAPGDPAEVTLGLAALEEPNGSGAAVSTAANGASASVTLQVRGSLYYPAADTAPSPLIVLVHGNHGSCATGSAPLCTLFERNDTGYAYLAANLASWGYVVFSLDQDQLIQFQDGNYGKGMHQRRLLIAAALDGLWQANQPGGIPIDANDNIGTKLVGHIDFSRIGLMGHSRGGDAVASFLAYNRARPLPGRRYAIRAVLSLAPVDYERTAPYGVVYGTAIGACDGDVTNMAGTRMFARSLRILPTDPFPRIQMILQGANHDAFNTEWDSDGDDAATPADQACGPYTTSAVGSTAANPTSIRLEPVGTATAGGALAGNYTHGKTAAAPQSTFWQDNPALMGDQQKAGLAMMAEFFRRYVGGETPFDPYMTGEVSGDGITPQLPASACPTSAPGAAIPCFDRLQTTYFAAPQEREDVIRPEPDTPTTVSAFGTAINSGGFDYAYTNSPGVYPPPAATPTGLDWCNPEPLQFTPSQLGIGTSTSPPAGEPVGSPPTNAPTAAKSCPLPGYTSLGGQSATRENAPANHSYQLQLTAAWNNPVAHFGAPAYISTQVPALDGDVSRFKALALDAAVNFFDPRNPARTAMSPTNPALTGLEDPAATTQNFTISLTDAAGHTVTVQADNPRYGLALHQTVGTSTVHVHVILEQIRVPLTDFSSAGVDLHNIRNFELTFGDTSIPGMPASGSIELANVRFQEAVTGPTVFADSPNANGPAATPALRASDAADPEVALGLDPAPAADPNGPDAAQVIDDTPRDGASPDLPDVVWLDGGGSASQAAASAALGITSRSLSDPLGGLSGPGCTSRALSTKLAEELVVHQRVNLSGTAHETACRGAGIRMVEVMLYKHVGHAECRELTGSGLLTKPLACSDAFSLIAKGTTKWSLSFPRKLPKGSYEVVARAVDASGHEGAVGKPMSLRIA